MQISINVEVILAYGGLFFYYISLAVD